MSFYKLVYLLVIFITSLISLQVIADENKEFDGNKLLLESCKVFNVTPEHRDALHCIYYIRGVLAGTWNLDQEIATKLKEKSRSPSTWSERVYQTRIGKRMERAKATKFTHFCSPDDESEARIIEKISKISEPEIRTREDIHNQILSALKVICPDVKTKAM